MFLFISKWWRLVGNVFQNQLVCRELFLFLPHCSLWIALQIILTLIFGPSIYTYYFLIMLLFFFAVLFCIIRAALDYYDEQDEETDPLERAQQDLAFGIGAIALSVYATCYALVFSGPVSMAFSYLFFQTNVFTILLYLLFIRKHMQPLERTCLHTKIVYLHYFLLFLVYISIIFWFPQEFPSITTKICGNVMSFGVLAYILMVYPPVIGDFVLVVRGGLKKQHDYI
uniref:Transmembrane protein n=1 Tax=Caenorhabditis tropicalis TaxID=1561998 RepID=A0A1I7UN82_9PELO